MSKKVFESVTIALTALATGAVAVVGILQPPHAEIAQPVITAILGATEAIMGIFVQPSESKSLKL